jgi:hypothetical protein
MSNPADVTMRCRLRFLTAFRPEERLATGASGWPFERVAVLAERPRRLEVDDRVAGRVRFPGP